MHSIFALADSVLARRASLSAGVRRGYQAALLSMPLREGPALAPEIPPGMLDALVVAGLLRPSESLDRHYQDAMPGLLAVQLRGAGVAEEPLFSAPLELLRMPRLRAGLEALFSLVARAGVSCTEALGAATPDALVAAHPTLGHLFASCHFGRSMPMLYAYPGDLLPEAWAGRSALDFIEARYVGPLVHELSHLHARDPLLVPAPANMHEGLAAWIGSEAWPAQLWPAPGDEDALPGGAFFAALGGFLAHAIGSEGAIRAQAGLLDLRDALGAPCAEALRLYGWLTFLETGAPHLLSDAFAPGRFWKLIDLHRDPALARELHERLAAPLLAAPPPPGTPLKASWDSFLDSIPWSSLPAWRDAPCAADRALALRAVRALEVRSVLVGLSFRANRCAPPGPLLLDVANAELRAPFEGPDAVGAPPVHPYPPALCAELARAGHAQVEFDPRSLPA